MLALLSNAVLVGCGPSKDSEGLTVNPTIYYKPTIHQDEMRCEKSAMKEVLSPEDKVLGHLCANDFDLCLMQGSCFVQTDDEVVSFNYHSVKNGTHRFFISSMRCPYGFGARQDCMDPYFSVAADFNFYKVGDVIFVPRLIGAVMPNGEVHDGFLIVRDTGSGIIGANRFDFFTGIYSHLTKKNPFVRLGFSDPRNSFEFRMATATEAAAVRKQRNYPGLKKSVLDEKLF
ncbi:MAG: 3D domain-containing protein [Bdellovibrio sp.]